MSTSKLLMHVLSILFILSTVPVGFSNDTCENINPISRIVLSMSSRLPDIIGGDANIIFSPFSISVALAMLYVGTQGQTKEEMKTALGYHFLGQGLVNQEISEGFKYIISSLRTNYASSVSVANNIFIQDGFSVSPDYLSKLLRNFKSEIRYANFSGDANQAMEAINSYVANRTNSQIMKILNEPLDPLTVMVLMNVIYFKGVWKNQFLINRTKISFFYMPDGTLRYVPFMFLQKDFYYFHDSVTNTSYLEMDYSNGNMTMLLALSSDRKKIPQISNIMDIICHIKPQMEIRNVQLALPKFRLEFSRELSKDMMEMGMKKLFSDRADLTGIREQNDLHVSLMVHKSIIEVDEKGSEASAVSGVGIYGRVKNRNPEKFWANHPFLFYIIDRKMDLVLFAGRVTDPSLGMKTVN